MIETTNGETNRLEDMTISVTENGATTTVPFADIANPTTGTIRKIGDGVVISETTGKNTRSGTHLCPDRQQPGGVYLRRPWQRGGRGQL